MNHTSSDSKWLLSSKDSYYSPANTPLLTTAFVLDKALNDFSNLTANKQNQDYPKENLVESVEDIDLLMSVFEKKFLPTLNIPDYFCFNILETIKKLQEEMQKSYPSISIKHNESEIEEEASANIFAKDKDDILEEFIVKHTAKLGVSIEGPTLNFQEIAKNLSENSQKYSYELYKIVFTRLNERQKTKIHDILNEALKSVRDSAIYKIVKCKNPLITLENPLFPIYFTQLPNGEAAANNGWILYADPRENFAESENLNYLRRNIVIWDDLVKLRYGEKKSDSPFLWKHMKKYVQNSANFFHGFRIDNAHSTPLHVGEYFLKKARESNPNLHVICELFCGGQDLEAKYVKILGANALVKEVLNVILLFFLNQSYFCSVMNWSISQELCIL